MTPKPGRRRWAMYCGFVAVCVLLGIAVARGHGLQAIVLGIGTFALAAASSTPWLAIAVFMGVTSLFGSVSLVSLGGIPDVTVTRVLAAWIVLLAVTRWKPMFEVQDDQEERARFLTQVTIAIAILVAFGLLAALKNTSLTTGLQLYLDQIIVPFGLLGVLAAIRFDRETAEKVILSVAWLGVMWSVIGLYEFATGRSLFAAGGELRWARETYARVGGPFINPAGLGTAIGMGLIAAIGTGLTNRTSPAVRAGMIAVCILGLAVTLTRGSWIAVVAAILVIGVLLGLRGVVTWVGAALAAVGIGYVLLQVVGEAALLSRLTGEGPVYNRVIVYFAALRLIAANPLLGVGFGMFAPAILPYMGPVGDVGASYGIGVFAPHNSALHAAAEMGIPAMLTIVAAWVLATRRVLSHDMGGPFRWVRVIGPGLIVVYVVNAMTIDMWLTANLNAFVYALIGVLCGVPVLSAYEESHEERVSGARP